MSSNPRVSDLQFYKVHPGQPVRLRVVVGNGMAGGTSLMLKGDIRQIGNEQVTIGSPGEDLRRSVLHCVTTVKDINPATDLTVVTYYLEGGEQSQSYPYNVPVSTPGGYARYEIDFAFV